MFNICLLIAPSISLLNLILELKKYLLINYFHYKILIVCNCDMVFTPALITFFGLPFSTLVKDMLFAKIIKIFGTLVKTGPIIILTPSSYNSLIF